MRISKDQDKIIRDALGSEYDAWVAANKPTFWKCTRVSTTKCHLTYDEVETIKTLIGDWFYFIAKAKPRPTEFEKDVAALATKLGMDD